MQSLEPLAEYSAMGDAAWLFRSQSRDVVAIRDNPQSNSRFPMLEVTGLHQYGYDKLYRLTTVDYARYPDQAYSYDPSGNRLTLEVVGKDTQTYSYDSASKLQSVTEGSTKTDYAWDEAGNLKTKAESVGGKTEYTFDGANRLAGATLPSGQSLTYGYDSDGHRVYRKEGDEKTWFVFDGLSVVMEMDKDRKATAAIVPGVSKTNLSYRIPVTEYCLYDGLGSVVMLTDVLGNPTQIYQYDVFGGTQNLNRDPLNKYRFVGLAQDDSLGLTYMNARWYDPRVGRFVSADPLARIGPNIECEDCYSYARSNPANYVDITGEYAVPDEAYYTEPITHGGPITGQLGEDIVATATAIADYLFGSNEDPSDERASSGSRVPVADRSDEAGAEADSPGSSSLPVAPQPALRDRYADSIGGRAGNHNPRRSMAYKLTRCGMEFIPDPRDVVSLVEVGAPAISMVGTRAKYHTASRPGRRAFGMVSRGAKALGKLAGVVGTASALSNCWDWLMGGE
jgi:RHS repeat-associated protein